MCGIVGSNFKSDSFYNSIKLLNHRGPDNLGYMQYNNNQFGHTRLSIIDLDDEANQPMEYDDIIITFNGEIYNYKELISSNNLKCKTKSDTEVLIRLYQKYDTEFLNMIEGMFSFCIFDKKKNRFFCARDRFGKKPLYYYYKDGRFIYASEIKAILNILKSELSLNNTALYEYLSFLTPINGNTFYKGINKLEASSYFTLQNKELKISKYFDFNNIEYQNDNEDIILKNVEDILIEATKKRLVSDVSVGTFLSGGIDSSFISSLYSKISNTKIDTFSLGFDEMSSYNELPYAKQVSKFISSNHHEVIITKKDYINNIDEMISYCDEPFADTASIPTYLLSKFTKENGIKVVLSGEGGDENFLGYGLYSKLLNYQTSLSTSDFNLTREWEYDNRLRNNQRIYQSYGECFTESQKERLFVDYKKIYRLSSYTSSYDNLKWMSYIDFKVWISEVLMTKVDRMSMANSLEVRAPFLDHKLVKYLFSVDNNIKKGNTSKYLLKKIALKYLPKEIVYREKKGFSSPYIEWLFQEYKDEVLLTILRVNSQLKLFNEEFVKFLYNEAKEKRFKQHLWNLFIFSRWFEKVYL
jgi:asparagine synthase (glutamine-hydrolysing)